MTVSRGTPKRIQRRRTKGWRMTEGAVYVGRPSRWGNPFVVRPTWGPEFCRTAEEAVANFRSLMARRLSNGASQSWLEPLRGRDLACWCPLDVPCHADVLLELANA